MSTPLMRLAETTRDKQKALDAALTQIERAFGKGAIMKLGGGGEIPAVEAISTGSLGLDVDRRPSLSHDRNTPTALIYLAISLHEVAFYRRRWRATLRALFLEKSAV